MNRRELADQIVTLCLDKNNFLVLLHSFAYFDDEKYKELLSLIEKYTEKVKNDDQIDREVVGCLIHLMIALDNALISFKEMKKPEYEKVVAAHSRIHSLMLDELLLIHPN